MMIPWKNAHRENLSFCESRIKKSYKIFLEFRENRLSRVTLILPSEKALVLRKKKTGQ